MQFLTGRTVKIYGYLSVCLKLRIRAYTRFAGCGGMTRGMQDAGLEVVGAFENRGKAADCYEANFSHPVYRDDLSDTESAIKKILLLNPDMIIGGPPCQDYSTAGKRVEGERANLTVSFAQIIANVAPRFFIMENVPGVEKSKSYKVAKKIYKDAGYGLTEVVLNAALCGVPQRRKRFFCFGVLGAEEGCLSGIIEKKSG